MGNLRLLHAPQQAQQAPDIVGVVVKRSGHRIADGLVGREVHAAVHTVLADDGRDRPSSAMSPTTSGTSPTIERWPSSSESRTTTSWPPATSARVVWAPM